MENIKLILAGIAIVGCQLLFVHCQHCEIVSDLSGTMKTYERDACWEIQVPTNHFIHLRVINIMQGDCGDMNVKIYENKTEKEYQLCGYSMDKNPIIAFSDVTVKYQTYYYYGSLFEMDYKIQNIECMNKSSFRCSNHTCIPEYQVCDGEDNCENGADEIGCESVIKGIKGIATARESALSWLKSTRTASWGWRENTPRSVVALFLASGANFNGTDLEEELMAKETELKISVSLLRTSLSNNQLSMFLNSLLVICHNPRSFYGNNLVKRLKEQVEQTQNFTHPVAYLALCNANETWPEKAIKDLDGILSSESDYPFVRDIQAMAVMALSCEKNFIKQYNTSQNSSTFTLYQDAIRRFKGFQQTDGSFGNVYTTAMITQALISSGEEDSEDWKLNATMQYLMKHLNSSSLDFLSTYLTLPLLNGKTLSDIANMNCSQNPRKRGDDIVSEINDYLGPKMRIQYSLFIGDDKDIIHTFSLLVPVNYTALEVMELAEVENIKYRFKGNIVSGKVYVYEIANITNDLEAGKFWLLYLGNTQGQGSFKHLTLSVDELVMEDGEHLIMWYKTASI